jgi:hypothetical protein
VSSNPARSAMIQDLLKTIKNKCSTEGNPWNHVKAMAIKDMEKLMKWSESLVPHGMVDYAFKDATELAEVAEHFFIC